MNELMSPTTQGAVIVLAYLLLTLFVVLIRVTMDYRAGFGDTLSESFWPRFKMWAYGSFSLLVFITLMNYRVEFDSFMNTAETTLGLFFGLIIVPVGALGFCFFLAMVFPLMACLVDDCEI